MSAVWSFPKSTWYFAPLVGPSMMALITASTILPLCIFTRILSPTLNFFGTVGIVHNHFGTGEELVLDRGENKGSPDSLRQFR